MRRHSSEELKETRIHSIMEVMRTWLQGGGGGGWLWQPLHLSVLAKWCGVVVFLSLLPPCCVSLIHRRRRRASWHGVTSPDHHLNCQINSIHMAHDDLRARELGLQFPSGVLGVYQPYLFELRRQGDAGLIRRFRISSSLGGHIGSMSSVRWDDTGTLLASAGEDSRLGIWRAEDPCLLHSIDSVRAPAY